MSFSSLSFDTSPPAYPGLAAPAAAAVAETERALSGNRIDDAERHVMAAIRLAPMHPDVLHQLGNVYARRGRFADALKALQHALSLRPEDGAILVSTGIALGNAGQPDDAIAVLRRACAIDPGLANGWFNLAVIHVWLAEYDQAIEALQRVPESANAYNDAQALLADILRQDGRLDDAAAAYRAILARKPWAGMAWWGLANIKTVPLQASDVEQINLAQGDQRASAHDRVALSFALAKGLEDQQRYADAFAALRAANDRARAGKPPWNGAAMSAKVDGMLASFAKPAVTDSDFGSEALFVVSLPRSGSTLTEQILASHPQVEGASELNDVTQVFAEESQRRRQHFVDWATQLGASDWRRLGERYLDRTARWRTQRPRFTNKMPVNWIYAGAILAMLPGARIVICRRDPLETCFALYRQMLPGYEYTHDFSHLAEHWRDFDRAARHWHASDPQRVRVQVYEDLVSDAETQTRELLAFCGLPFDPACLRFYENERRVRTPSAAQVREPLRRDTARAPKYGALLDPLRAALGLPLFAAPP